MWRSLASMSLGAWMLVGSAAGQAQYQPTPEPTITAEASDWYNERSPIQHAGNTYYPAGAPVFFDGNSMVRSGWYRGVPLYADTTVEPFSIVLVPIGGRRLQPYERRREGDVEGTSGSRTASLPTGPESPGVGTAGTVPPAGIMAPAPPVGPNPDAFQPPLPLGGVVPSANVPSATVAVAPAPPNPPESRVRTLPARPRASTPRQYSHGNLSSAISIDYGGTRWKLAGEAVPFEVQRYVQVGTYRGFPVYTLRHSASAKAPQRIFIVSTLGGLVTPYVRTP